MEHDNIDDLGMSIFHAIYEPALLANRDGIIAAVNDAWRKEAKGRVWEQIGAGASLSMLPGYDKFADGLRAVLRAECDKYQNEFTFSDGASERYYQLRVTPVRQADHLEGVLLVYRNMTSQRTLERILNEGADHFKLIAEHSHDMIKITDVDGNVVYASPSHMTILGYMEQANLFGSLLPEDSATLRQLYEEIRMCKESRQLEFRKKHKNGSWVWVETNVSPVIDDRGEVINMVLVTREITERKQYEAELERLAYKDYLTGVDNRRKLGMVLDERLADAVSEGSQLAILLMDLDQFKSINDTYGHDAGDLVLMEFVRRLVRCKRESDVAGRMSGDEFLVVMNPVSSKNDIHRFTRELKVALKEPYCLPNSRVQIPIRASIGYAIYPEHGLSKKKLFKHADISLYKKKRKRKHAGNPKLYVRSEDN